MDNIKINRQQLRRIILKEFLDTSQGRGGGGGMSWEQVTQ